MSAQLPVQQQQQLFFTLNSLPAGCRHSWKDDAQEKFAALQKLGKEFEAEHGRACTVWLDKLCINQSEIDEDLKCLPFFIMGCRNLLVLLGQSYARRLWYVFQQ